MPGKSFKDPLFSKDEISFILSADKVVTTAIHEAEQLCEEALTSIKEHNIDNAMELALEIEAKARDVWAIEETLKTHQTQLDALIQVVRDDAHLVTNLAHQARVAAGDLPEYEPKDLDE